MVNIWNRRAYLVMFGAIVLSACAKSRGPHQSLPHPLFAKSEMISFNQILPIINVRCARCHNEGENDWTQEANLKRVAKSGALVLRLNTHTMPQEGSPESMSITEQERELIVHWAEHVSIETDGHKSSPVTEE